MALPKLTLKGQDFTTDNFGTNNFGTNNIATNNYMTYKWKADRNKIVNKFVSPPPYVNTLQQEIERKKEYWFDYDNPNQVNSYADVIMRTLVSLKDNITGAKSFSDTGKQFASDTTALLYKGTIQPLLSKDPGALLNNAFVNLGETVDLLDNIWKGFAINSGMLDFQGKKFNLSDGWEGMRQVIVDRKNFDFDTGSRLADFALELLTPTNIALAVASLGVGSAGKAAVKSAATSLGDDAVEAVTKRLAKGFFKNYTGDTAEAMLKINKNLTKAEIEGLEAVAKHATNLQLISAVNKFRKAVDAVDSIGPSIAIQGTVGIPWKLIKGISKVPAAVIRYFAKGVDDIFGGVKDPGLFVTVAKAPEINKFINNLSDANEIINQPDVMMGLNHVISAAANSDNKKLKGIYQRFMKNFDSKELIQQYISTESKKRLDELAADLENLSEETAETISRIVPLEEAQRVIGERALNELVHALDEFAKTNTGGLYKTFDEYMNFVTILHGVGQPSKGIKELYSTITRLQEKMQYQVVYNGIDVIDKTLTDIIEDNTRLIATKESLSHLNEGRVQRYEHDYKQALEYMSDSQRTRADSITRVAQVRLNESARAFKSAEDTKFFLAYLKGIPDEIAELEIQRLRDYKKYLAKRKKNPALPAFDASQYDSQINRLQKTLEQYPESVVKTLEQQLTKQLEQATELRQSAYEMLNRTNLLKRRIREAPMIADKAKYLLENFDYDAILPKDLSYIKNAAIIDIDLLSNRLKELRAHFSRELSKDNLSPFRKDILTFFQTRIDEITKDLLKSATNHNLALEQGVYTKISDFGQVYFKAIEDAQKLLQDMPDDYFKTKDLQAGINQLSKSLYGENILNFAKDMIDNLENKFKDQNISVLETKVKHTFYKADGTLDAPVFNKYLDDINSLIKSIDMEMLEGMGELQGTGWTMAELTTELIQSLSSLEIVFKDLVDNFNRTKDIDTTLLADVFDYLITFKYSIEKTIKNLKLKEATNPSRQYVSKVLTQAKASKLLSSYTDVLDRIAIIQDTLGLSADVEVKWTEQVLNTYGLKLNAALRNLYILQTSDLDTLLDAVAMGAYSDIPALESLEYVIQHYKIAELQNFKTVLAGNNIEAIEQMHQLIIGTAYNESKMPKQKLIEAIENIITVKKSAETIMDTLEGMVSVRKLYSNIQDAINKGLDKNVASSFLDAIQRLYDKPASLISLKEMRDEPWKFKAEINNVIHNIEMQLRGATLKYNVKAESWRSRIIDLYNDGKLSDEAVDDYFKMFGGTGSNNTMTHTAIADAYSEFLVHRHYLKDQDLQKYKYIYMDIEGNGLNLEGATLYQQSVVIPEHNIFNWYINVGVKDNELPNEDELYYLLFGDEQHTMDLNTLKDLFKKIYQQGDMDALRAHFGITDPRIKIIPVNGEAELIKQAMDFATSQKPPDGALRYRLHNGLEYDIPLLNNRARRLGLDGYHIGLDLVEDTKIALEDKLKLRRLSIEEKETIEQLIVDHIITRNSELSAAALKRSGTSSVIDLDKIAAGLEGNLGKFLPTLDHEFYDAYEKLMLIFDPTNYKASALYTIDSFGEIQDLAKELTEAMASVRASLVDLKQLETRLKSFRIIVDATNTAGGSRMLPKDWFDKIPEKLRANHVGVDMMSFNSVDGVYVPAIAPKARIKPNIVAEYFDLKGKLTTPNMMERMTDLAGNIQKTMLRIRDVDTINNLDLDELHKLHNAFLEELRKVAGPTYFSPVLNDLKPGDTPFRAFATTYELFKLYDRIASGNFLLKTYVVDGIERLRYPFIRKLEEDGFEDLITLMRDSKSLFKRMMDEYGDSAKLFHKDPPPGNLGEIFKWFGDYAELHIETLEDLEHAINKLQYAKVLRAIPVYRTMLDSFKGFQKAVDETRNYMARLHANGTIKKMPSNLEDLIFAKLRPIVESYDALLSFNKLKQVLSYTPEQMASYLRHQAKGLVIFNNKHLYSEYYFPQRHTLSQTFDIIKENLEDIYIDLFDKKADYEKLGINFKVVGENTVIYFNKAGIDKIKDVPYIPINQDFDMAQYLDLIVNNALRGTDDILKYIRDSATPTIKNALKSMTDSRKQLTTLARDANTSTLEVLDDIAMDKLLLDLQRNVPDIISVEEMKHLGMFEANHFNHSVLGHIDGRRTFMHYSSFNPAKNLFNAAQLVENKLGVQTLYTNLMFVPEFKINNIISQGKMSKQQVIDYLKKAPHLKVAFLNDKSKGAIKDFRLSAVTINSIKDLEFAMKMDAVIVDRQTYNTAYEVINNYKIKNGALRFLDRVLVAPYKLGWLSNIGTMFRNLVDTATKNIASTKSAEIVPVMFDMTKDYFKYRSVQTAIYRYAEAQRITIDVAVDEFFAKNPDVGITREIFDMIVEYQKAGGQMSLVKEAIDYYGDITDKMYQRVGYDQSGLIEKEFKEFLKMPDDVALQFLKNKFGNNTPHIQTLMDVKQDRLIYRRAYEMHKHYKGRDLSVEDFVAYLKSGRVQPTHLDEMQRLLEKTKGVTAKDDMLTKVLQHPLMSSTLSANMQIEEILRLSMYRYLRHQGYTTAETMAKIAETHFDYGHKHWSQLYLEMLMPFSTFRTMNIVYWAETLLDNHQAVEVMTKGWQAFAQQEDRDIEDVIMRRGLQYQMQTGNLVLDEESGLTLKLNPSALDALAFFVAPQEYITNSFHSAGQAALNLVTMRPYDYETEAEFLERKQRTAIELIPLVGAHINRMRSANNPLVGFVFGPLFNTTWTPEQGGAYATWNQNKYVPFVSKFGWKTYPRYGYRKYPSKYRYYARKYYSNYRMKLSKVRFGYKDWSGYSTFNRTYYGAYFKFRRGSAYPTKNYRSLNTAFSDMWRLSMTRKGKPKYGYLNFPTNKWTLRLKVNILRNITSYNRWQ